MLKLDVARAGGAHRTCFAEGSLPSDLPHEGFGLARIKAASDPVFSVASTRDGRAC